MKVLVLFLFIIFSIKTQAGFDKSTHNFGNYVPKNETLSASFKFKNPGPSPAILIVGSDNGLFKGCQVTSYTKAPIPKNYIGSVNVSCRFNSEGFNQKQVASVQIHQQGGNSSQQLSVKGMVVEASDCNPMDLNRDTVLKKIPTLDQDGMGICYAFTASQMIEFEARKNGINRSFSPIDASFVAKANDKSETYQLDAGVLDKTIEAILKQGIASRTCIDEVIRKHTIGTTLSSEEFLALVEDVWMARRKKTPEEKIKKDLKSTCDQYGISTKQFSDLLKDLDKPFKAYLTDMFKECDEERKHIKAIRDLNLDLDLKASGSNAEITKYLDNFLDHNRLPSVAICAEIVKGKPGHRGLTISNGKREYKKNKDGKKDCGVHSVLITGRRKVGYTCEYLIRNSWGGSWAQKGLTCACKTPTAYYQDCSQSKESSGNKVMVGCWVKEESLIPNTKNVLGFK